ncbi:ATP synthase epsilon chain (plasmid) [Caballeronia sp. SBC1]|uniref:F0F1 ATP synthase subunit epsilon n=1 Tax=unclassified Caballeronia TaxID=2646786 RepID=UPI0013E17179|nr:MULTISPECIES: F0F1 ATP synthase subunit epsilon [unclassified Caballeronia]QIE25599.1 ATP synthase epsilon chain [Caballeronia sp. SBC2]QIN65089.1 ATP synthase epsilon chain [Caballeronia sp. SBC1]
MSTLLHLTIATPARVLFDSTEVVALRAEDATGSFGILPGHAAFLTVLAPSVLRWHGADGVEQFCAVKEGVLRVSDGQEISIACREGVMGASGTSLEVIEAQVDAARAAQLDAVRRARVDETRLHAQAVRQLLRYLRPGARPTDGAGP